ncbi:MULTISPECIES: histidine phosphatase family protein [Aeromicrobium]|uniref:Histidine phosphatase family protein n=1 Tax=Aeromicrobium yanjiei TaxID=2662028 RepID=A0A5Q2MCE0_9ACTN|nr:MULTISPECIES: histidine phosphatase family protein [Aeromicrobium]MRK03182.1 histidine phosphatase family protein [Aeromicrobium sp. S22]QGG40747.1 histidine phosphatase family protein [Aeromicrobium yanjiei]
MRLILIRHGQTPANVAGVLESTVPGPGLTDLGQEQAEELVDALSGDTIDAIFVSSMVRTHLTAAPLAAARGIEPIVRPGLREISAGDVEGNTDAESVHQYVSTLLTWCGGHLDVRMPGAETGEEVIARFDEVVAEAEALGVGTVALVSHGAIIRAWCATRTLNVDLEFVSTHYVVNTGIVVVEGSSRLGWEVSAWLGQSVSEAAARGVASDHSPAVEREDA